MPRLGGYVAWALGALAVGLSGCGSDAAGATGAEDRDTGSSGPPSVDGGYVDAGESSDTAWKKSEAGFVVPDAGTIPADRFITQVVSYTLGPCSGYGRQYMPGIVEGPPVGYGACNGSTNVLSLGNGGEIIVSFEPNSIIDGPGPDFIVFENPFYIECNPADGTYAEPGEVSVSDDGVNWTSFPCTDTTNAPLADGGYQSCAGVHPVNSNPTNGISPLDPETAGGDPFDLADIGVKTARYVRIVDKVIEPCSDAGDTQKNGFDLDAIAIIHSALPD